MRRIMQKNFSYSGILRRYGILTEAALEGALEDANVAALVARGGERDTFALMDVFARLGGPERARAIAAEVAEWLSRKFPEPERLQ
jgi:hypothetical protein